MLGVWFCLQDKLPGKRLIPIRPLIRRLDEKEGQSTINLPSLFKNVPTTEFRERIDFWNHDNKTTTRNALVEFGTAYQAIFILLF